MLVLLAGMLYVGISSLGSSSNGFVEYREFARDANLSGRLQANLLSARTEVKEYLIDHSEESKQAFHKRWEKMKEFIAEAKTEIQNPERAKMVADIDTDSKKYEDYFNDLVRLTEIEEKTLKTVLDVKGPDIEHHLTDLVGSAAKDNDSDAALSATTGLRSLLLARLYVNKYLRTNGASEADRVKKELDATVQTLNGMMEKLQHPERRRLCTAASESLKVYAENWSVIHETRVKRNSVVYNGLNKVGPAIAESAENVKLSVLKVQNELGPQLIAQNSSASKFIVVLGAGALVMGVAFSLLLSRSINRALEAVAQQLGSSSENVSSASTQVSSSSQDLAAGASEQASSLEETSASLEELSSMTKQNADNARQAKVMVEGVRTSAERGRTEMTAMTDSIGRIKNSADQTAKIVKTIDEIAFQTNLLALNAAVEAARAGDAGKGFAVVAEEVRNLAQRSAEAAKTTASLIDESQKNADGGVQVSQRVGATFEQIIKEIQSMSGMVAEVSSASDEQSKGIDQINTAVSQMDKVTQSCAANAEECAASSEELNAQAVDLREMVGTLQVMIRGHRSDANSGPAKRSVSAGKPDVSNLKEAMTKAAARNPSPTALVKPKAAAAPQKVAELDESDF